MSFVTAILLASGEGKRFQNILPKQFHYLSGKKLYMYALETFLSTSKVDHIILVVPKKHLSTVTKELPCHHKASITVIEGGATRQASSYLGILASPKKTTHVIIHDAVRPFVSKSIIEENILLATLHGACDTCIPSYDTIVHTQDLHTIKEIPKRSEYLRGQTPQTFDYHLIKKAHEEALASNIEDATDDCQLLMRLGLPVKIAQGSDDNIKITTELDLSFAEHLLRLKVANLPDLLPSTLKNKIYAITGASGGIGSETAHLLKSLGAHVLCISRNSAYKADLTSPEETKKIFQKIHEEYGPIDGLINAVGYLKIAPFKELSIHDIEKLIHTNFTSALLSCKYCSIKNGGSIINIASSSYTRGRASYGIYSAMKAAIVNFTQALAIEHPELLINSLIPPRTDTSMRRENFPHEDTSCLLSPKVVAKEVLKALNSAPITGATIDIKN